MEQGLVTKLKGSVSNETLEKLNTKTLRIFRTSAEHQYAAVSVAESKTVIFRKVGGDANIGGVSSTGRTFPGGSTTIEITGDLGSFIDVEVCNYFNLLTTLSPTSSNMPASFDVSIYAYRTGITSINWSTPVSSASRDYVSGNIIDLKRLIALSELNITADRKIVGDVSELASAQVAEGRTSGSLTIYGNASNVKKNGTPLGSSPAVITFNPELPSGYSIA